MRHGLTIDNKLNELGINLDYWRNKYEHCHKFFKAEYYKKYQEARKEFGEYHRAHYDIKIPKLKLSKDYIMIADLTERFEEFEH